MTCFAKKNVLQRGACKGVIFLQTIELHIKQKYLKMSLENNAETSGALLTLKAHNDDKFTS